MIKNLVFDVGNVLFEYRWIEALMDTGLSRDKALEAGRVIFEDKLWIMFDAGDIGVDDLIAEFGKKYPEYSENIADFILHPERMPIPRPEVWDKIRTLKNKGYKIYLLSNYSEHLFSSHTAGAQFLEDIDGKLVSYMVHQVKPDREIYESLLARFDLNPAECIFFDDRPENIQAGEEVGIKGRIVESRECINEMLQEMIDSKLGVV